MEVRDADYNDIVEGYYDLIEGIRCYDRPVYVKRNQTGEELIYINYYRDSMFNIGWIISKDAGIRSSSSESHISGEVWGVVASEPRL